jgi:8-oxo-dGTP pyrophosphatase MutT (NUDIX family)
MRIRRSSRLILLDEENRVLLFKVEDATVFRPGQPISPVFWITPGGGVEEGESDEEAVRRELWEETGIAEIELGPLVALCEPVLSWAGEIIQSHDRFYLTRLSAPVVTLVNMGQIERAGYRDHRWWSVDEINSTVERIVPSGLGELAARIVTGDIPTHPVIFPV